MELMTRICNLETKAKEALRNQYIRSNLTEHLGLPYSFDQMDIQITHFSPMSHFYTP